MYGNAKRYPRTKLSTDRTHTEGPRKIARPSLLQTHFPDEYLAQGHRQDHIKSITQSPGEQQDSLRRVSRVQKRTKLYRPDPDPRTHCPNAEKQREATPYVTNRH